MVPLVLAGQIERPPSNGLAIALGIVLSFFDDVGSAIDMIENCLGDPDALQCQ